MFNSLWAIPLEISGISVNLSVTVVPETIEVNRLNGPHYETEGSIRHVVASFPILPLLVFLHQLT